jgi:2-oxoisovalerate dehydrogenase E1 component
MASLKPMDSDQTSIELVLPPLRFDRKGFTNEQLLELYDALLLPRLIEEKSLNLLRQGKVSKWFSGIGQEAIAVGLTQALRSGDYILPLHRNLGVFTGREMPLEKLFAQWQGKKSGYTKGRDRSFHFGSPDDRVIGMISHLGAMLGVADGLALASNLDKRDDIAAVFSGDGGASEGDFHEAINVAAVWGLPVIFVIENNGYGLSTPSRDQFVFKQFIDKAIGYGIEGVQVDGNNILEVYSAVRKIAERMRQTKKPVLLECMTFRMRGHEEASGVKYVPQFLFDTWQQKDPVVGFEKFLKSEGVLSEDFASSRRAEIKKRIEDAWDVVFAEADLSADLDEELRDVYAVAPSEEPRIVSPETSSSKRFVDALSDGLGQAMEHDPQLVIMGQDVADYGGVFKVTQGFVERFGRDRVRNTPLCESAILGAGLGLAIAGRPSVVEMQFADFVSCGFNQIVNNLAKTHYRWAQPVNVTVRMPTGAGTGAGPFHSQSNEAWFTKVPGLKVVYPSTPHDAKGLICAAVRDPNPVMFFEHKVLYRSIEGDVPDAYYTLPIGKARVVREGKRATVIAYGAAVHWALEAAGDSDVEIIDLITLMPWDRETVFASVRKTNRVLVVHEDTLTSGFGGEIAAVIGEELFLQLDAPVMRVASLDTPVPFNQALEKQFLPKRRVKGALDKLLAY